ncbi:hypothetical protein COLO4_13724, partial [Corchorus olitorius]
MEDFTLDLEVGPTEYGVSKDWTVVGRVIAEKNLNRGAVKAILKNLWPEKDLLIIGDAGQNMYSLTFENEAKMQSALKEGLWSVMGFSLNLKPWPPDKSIKEVDLSAIPFWLQVHNLPREMMTSRNAERIGNRMGEVLEVKEPMGSFGLNRSFLRVRVSINVNDPLIPGFWIPRGGDRNVWAEVKYKKLSDFCFNCGKLGHGNKFCKSEVISPARFGAFMRAPPARSLLSPLKQRSHSWDGNSNGEEGSWRRQGVARKLQFNTARDTAASRAREMGVRQQHAPEAREIRGSILQIPRQLPQQVSNKPPGCDLSGGRESSSSFHSVGSDLGQLGADPSL